MWHVPQHEPSPFSLGSISAYIAEEKPSNVLPPIHLDASQSWEAWGVRPGSMDIIVNINMIHITPVICTEVRGCPGPNPSPGAVGTPGHRLSPLELGTYPTSLVFFGQSGNPDYTNQWCHVVGVGA